MNREEALGLLGAHLDKYLFFFLFDMTYIPRPAS